MSEWIVTTPDNLQETIEADKGYVDPNGTLRFYNGRDKHAQAQYAAGQWKKYKFKKD